MDSGIRGSRHGGAGFSPASDGFHGSLSLSAGVDAKWGASGRSVMGSGSGARAAGGRVQPGIRGFSRFDCPKRTTGSF